MIYVLGKRIFNILNHVIVPAKIQMKEKQKIQQQNKNDRRTENTKTK
jgi:hypothetical protein